MSDIIKEAREMLEGVTPGPWEWREDHPTNACANVTAADQHGSEIATLYGCSTDDVPAPTMPDEPWGDHPVRRANARFIAWCRENVPALIARIEALVGELKEAESEAHACGAERETWKDRAEAAEATLRMIVSHATGGQTTGDGMSVNDICIKITAFRNTLWKDAKEIGANKAESALAAERAKVAALVEALRVADVEIMENVSDSEFIRWAENVVSDIRAAIEAAKGE